MPVLSLGEINIVSFKVATSRRGAGADAENYGIAVAQRRKRITLVDVRRLPDSDAVGKRITDIPRDSSQDCGRGTCHDNFFVVLARVDEDSSCAAVFRSISCFVATKRIGLVSLVMYIKLRGDMKRYVATRIASQSYSISKGYQPSCAAAAEKMHTYKATKAELMFRYLADGWRWLTNTVPRGQSSSGSWLGNLGAWHRSLSSIAPFWRVVL